MSVEIEKTIRKNFQDVFKEQNQGASPPDLVADSVLLESGLDSLGFAILIVRLEEVLGFDPFVLSTEAFYPRTFGEFVVYYQANQPK